MSLISPPVRLGNMLRMISSVICVPGACFLLEDKSGVHTLYEALDD